MTKEELIQLHALLTRWITRSDWNRAGPEWANVVETKRQVEIDLRSIDPDWEAP